MKVFFIVAVNCILLTSPWPQDNKIKRMTKMSIYYETLCSDSKRFITRQLYPAYDTIKNYLKIVFIPYGKANTSHINGSWVFTCQHGPQECWGNQVQACVLAEHVAQDTHMDFINCFMDNNTRASESLAKTCTEKADMCYSEIKQCVKSGRGKKLLAMYGNITHKVLPHLNNVPTVVFNDKYDANLNEKANENLLITVSNIVNKQKERMLYSSKNVLT